MSSKAVKSVRVIFGQTLVAALGSAIVCNFCGDSSPTSVNQVIRKEYFLGWLCSATLAGLMFRTWRSRLGLWVWVVPAVWLGIGAVSLGRLRKAWYRLSGKDCVIKTMQLGCRYLFHYRVSHPLNCILSRDVCRSSCLARQEPKADRLAGGYAILTPPRRLGTVGAIRGIFLLNCH